ncbi:hypothetical protein ACFLZ7_01890 [Nanoarchaeota archaeon]
MLEPVKEGFRVMPFSSSMCAFTALASGAFLGKMMYEGPTTHNVVGAGLEAVCALLFAGRVKYNVDDYNETKKRIEKEGFSEEVMWDSLPYGGWVRKYAQLEEKMPEYTLRRAACKKKWTENSKRLDGQGVIPIFSKPGVKVNVVSPEYNNADRYIMSEETPSGHTVGVSNVSRSTLKLLWTQAGYI